MKKWSKSSSIRSCKSTDVDDDERHPRKTLIRMLSNNYKHVDINQNQQLRKMFTCNKCNKGFQSSKALCGHMACHSVKEKALMKKKNHLMKIKNSNSNTEESSVAKSLRSGSMRINKCKKLHEPIVTDYSNCSSSEASEVEQEQAEDVAICLMMLSRDSSNWTGLNPFNGTYKATNQCSKAVIHGRSHRGFNHNVAENHHKRLKAESTHESDENKCDEVSAIFKGNRTLLRNEIDLNLPASVEDEESN